MRFERFIVLACIILVILDILNKGFDYENILAAGLISAGIVIFSKIWVNRSVRLRAK